VSDACFHVCWSGYFVDKKIGNVLGEGDGLWIQMGKNVGRSQL